MSFSGGSRDDVAELPTDFVRAYRTAFGALPPYALRRAYSILAACLYWGGGGDGFIVARAGRGFHAGALLRGWDLLPAKTRVDRALRIIASEIARWAAEVERQGGG